MTGMVAENIYPLHEDIDIPPLTDDAETVGSGTETSVIFGLVSACGGSGVTTIAIQMAYHAAQTQDKRVALLSLDFENSSLSHYLDLRPQVTTEHFAQSTDIMDQQNCLSWMSSTKYGFDVLVLPNSIDGNSRVNHNSVIHFLDVVANSYDIIFLDVPKIWAPWTHAALGASDRTAFVTELNVPALHMTRSKYSALVKANPELGSPEIILNKFDKRVFKDSLGLSDAQKVFLNIPIHQLAENSRKISDSANRGEPMGEIYKKLKTATQINAVFDYWLSSCRQDSHVLDRPG